MTVFNEPSKWATTLGKDADVVVIPDSAGDTDPDIAKIFPVIFSVPLGNGGRAIPRSVLNGIFKLLGDWSFYHQNGGIATYSSDFDYVIGRVILYTDGNIYKCIQPNTITVGDEIVHVAPDSVSPNGLEYWQRLDSTSYVPNQIISSLVPLTDANLHLLDGSQLSLSGVYAGYVAMMKALYESDPTLECFTNEATWQSTVSSYGVCGKFVWDSVNETLRLPLVTGFIEGTITASELGSVVEAGIPNLVGQLAFNTPTYWDVAEAYGVFYKGINGNVYKATNVTTESGKPVRAHFDASKVSSIYKNSFNKVQPQSVKAYNYICVGTVSKTQIQIDIDQYLADLALKAGTDLSNINNTGKIACAHYAMPSGVYDDLTLGASGTSYTAPADGYFFVQRGAGTANGYILINSTSNSLSMIDSHYVASDNCRVFLPVKKGQDVAVTYTASGTGYIFRFIYAVGSESEQ